MISPPASQEKIPELITHSITPSFTLFVNFAWKPSGSVSLFSMVCPGLLAQHRQHRLPFLYYNVRSVDGLHCAGARISSGVQKLHTKCYRSLSRTGSTASPKLLTSYECNESRQWTTGKSGQHAQLRRCKAQGKKIRYRKRRERGLWVYTILTCAEEWDPHNPQILHLRSPVNTLKGDSTPDPIHGVTCLQSPGWPPPRPWNWVTCSQYPRWTPSQTLKLGSRIHRYVQGWTLKDHFQDQSGRHRKTIVCDAPSR